MTQEQLTAAIQALLAEALGVPLESVSPELAFGDLPEWDSLGHMEILLRLEEQYGLEVNAESIATLVSLPAIRAALENKE